MRTMTVRSTIARPLILVAVCVAFIYCSFGYLSIATNFVNFKINELRQTGQEAHDATVAERAQWGIPVVRTGEYYLPSISTRWDIPMVLQELQFESGMELGVWRGDFSKHLLDNWPRCERFYLVDPWQLVDDFNDAGSNDQYLHRFNENFDEAKRNLEKHDKKTTFMRMTGKEAAVIIKDHSLDFIYIDARHDYLAVLEDLTEWWPKVRPGGVFAGHDYASTQFGALNGINDWTLAADGKHYPGGVRRAVDEFARREQMIVTFSYNEPMYTTSSWMIRKPFNKNN